MKAISAIVMLAIAMLCACAMASIHRFPMELVGTHLNAITSRMQFRNMTTPCSSTPGMPAPGWARLMSLKFWEITWNPRNISRRLSMRLMGP